MHRILVIEDDKSMRELIREHLQDRYEIIETGDATEALILALRQKPDVILLDLKLPEFSGFELCQTFTSLNQTRLIPVLVITSKPAQEYRDFCLNLGAADYLEKPLDFARLKVLVDAVVDTRPSERRRERRVHLNVVLKLRGVDAQGNKFEALTAADDVSANGFLASCSAALSNDAIVEVFFRSNGDRYAGRAQIVRTEWHGTPWERHGCRFLNKPQHWVLE